MYEPTAEFIGRGDGDVVVEVNPGIVVVAPGVEPDIPEVGNVGTGGSVANCNRGAAGALKAFSVCAA